MSGPPEYTSSPRRVIKPIASRNCDDPRIDYKETAYLTKFLNPQMSIYSRRRTGFCTQCQKQLKLAIKRARHLGLMPFVG